MRIPVKYTGFKSNTDYYIGNALEASFPRHEKEDLDKMRKEEWEYICYFPAEFDSEVFPRKGDYIFCYGNPEYDGIPFPVVGVMFDRNGEITIYLDMPEEN